MPPIDDGDLPPVDEPDDKPDIPPPPAKPAPHEHPEIQAMIKALEIKLNAGADIVERMNLRIGDVEQANKQINDQVNKQVADQVNKQIVDVVNKMPGGGNPVDLGPIEDRLNDLENRPDPEMPTPVDLGPIEQRLTDLEGKRIILKATSSGSQLPDSESGKLGDPGNPYVAIDVSRIENPNE